MRGQVPRHNVLVNFQKEAIKVFYANLNSELKMVVRFEQECTIYTHAYEENKCIKKYSIVNSI